MSELFKIFTFVFFFGFGLHLVQEKRGKKNFRIWRHFRLSEFPTFRVSDFQCFSRFLWKAELKNYPPDSDFTIRPDTGYPAVGDRISGRISGRIVPIALACCVCHIFPASPRNTLLARPRASIQSASSLSMATFTKSAALVSSRRPGRNSSFSTITSRRSMLFKIREMILIFIAFVVKGGACSIFLFQQSIVLPKWLGKNLLRPESDPRSEQEKTAKLAKIGQGKSARKVVKPHKCKVWCTTSGRQP